MKRTENKEAEEIDPGNRPCLCHGALTYGVYEGGSVIDDGDYQGGGFIGYQCSKCGHRWSRFRYADSVNRVLSWKMGEKVQESAGGDDDS